MDIIWGAGVILSLIGGYLLIVVACLAIGGCFALIAGILSLPADVARAWQTRKTAARDPRSWYKRHETAIIYCAVLAGLCFLGWLFGPTR